MCARPLPWTASQSVWSIVSADGIICICINMCTFHRRKRRWVIKGAAAILRPTSLLYLYCPYKRNGFATASSNQAFDHSLRDRNPNWNLRDLQAVAATAQSVGFSAPVITEMPGVPPNVIVSLRDAPPANGRFWGYRLNRLDFWRRSQFSTGFGNKRRGLASEAGFSDGPSCSRPSSNGCCAGPASAIALSCDCVAPRNPGPRTARRPSPVAAGTATLRRARPRHGEPKAIRRLRPSP